MLPHFIDAIATAFMTLSATDNVLLDKQQIDYMMRTSSRKIFSNEV